MLIRIILYFVYLFALFKIDGLNEPDRLGLSYLVIVGWTTQFKGPSKKQAGNSGNTERNVS